MEVARKDFPQCKIQHEREGKGQASDKVTREEISSRDHIVKLLALLPQGFGGPKAKTG